MTILICPLSQVTRLVVARSPELVVSLLDPGFAFPETGAPYRGRHLRLQFHDAHAARDGQIVPTARDVDELLTFLAGWRRTAPLLVHCRAGIGRSPATAFIAACQHHPDVDERIIIAALRRASPHARPNETLVHLADDMLGRHGRMLRAVQDSGRGLAWTAVGENTPFELPARFD